MSTPDDVTPALMMEFSEVEKNDMTQPYHALEEHNVVEMIKILATNDVNDDAPVSEKKERNGINRDQPIFERAGSGVDRDLIISLFKARSRRTIREYGVDLGFDLGAAGCESFNWIHLEGCEGWNKLGGVVKLYGFLIHNNKKEGDGKFKLWQKGCFKICRRHVASQPIDIAIAIMQHRCINPLSSSSCNTGNNAQAIDHVVKRLGSTFAIQDMGKLTCFLGIEAISTTKGLMLSQRKYMLELLNRAGLSHAKLVPTPITTTANLALGDSSLFENPVKYRQIVGDLQYITLSRPDITFAVNKVCQFMHSPTDNHWSAVKRILRYLQGTSDFSLLLQHHFDSVVHAYSDAAFPFLNAFSDADWAGCPDDRRSTGGFAIYLGSNLISWFARKQKTVSRSSIESEYKALADTVSELTWLQTLLQELRVPMSSIPTFWCDNLGATYLSANPVFHARTKHVEVDFHFVREKVAQGKLSVQFISTNDQIADVFTKPLSSQRFLSMRSKLQVAPRP
ncbi:hypothetical protein E3N88_04539 [Mikania micrantha]|uniref:Reverse transcriptase Ty1/copia-type domain-containing protein n=1 Tax=Mikania micrantha TaxID=192012 RepID=A0A5N6PWT3_9ASTR|nr:hypothetical protein E3N88_04539 [Mikania micrantha]